MDRDGAVDSVVDVVGFVVAHDEAGVTLHLLEQTSTAVPAPVGSKIYGVRIARGEQGSSATQVAVTAPSHVALPDSPSCWLDR